VFSQLGLKFHHRLEAAHVIDRAQVWAHVIPKSAEGAFCFAFHSRN